MTEGTTQLIRQLQETQEQTLRCFMLSGDDLARTYAPGKWPVRFILHHLADAETVLFDRIRRVLSEPRQVLWEHHLAQIRAAIASVERV
jgi:hypothetical protein